jgi:hypothetical protein
MAGFFILLPLPLPATPPHGEGPRGGRVNGGSPSAARAAGFRSRGRMSFPRPGNVLARMGDAPYDGLTNRPHASSFEMDRICGSTPPPAPVGPDGPELSERLRFRAEVERSPELMHRSTRGGRMVKTKLSRDLLVRESSPSKSDVTSEQPSLEAIAAPHRIDAVAPPSTSREIQ